MAITKKHKKDIISNFEEKIKRSKSIVFTKFFGVGANDINDLRDKFKSEGGEYFVAKKTLMEKAFENSEIEGVKPRDFEGEVAAIFGYEDEVSPAKIINEFAKSHEKMEVVGGVLENKFISAAQVKNLAMLPSREELYAKVVGSINAPISGFVNVLAGNLRGLATVLKAISEKKS
ncbi:50S ribosomal protein L10 [Candidatus Falkowbacteria bacterium CG10_big_fil_rev_8_21_14_0_10_37_6]|uniref:Large ribosomal subunit protein uL10 n=1 Tax=Candidatus Falkowbacteria bacterium CG10_big_fil_rev_8_21_14_0_10_37_6 TaxID=1974563 RepID=A0A2H0V9E1_9BACT|nr:MAG: 50S ribosomal protein L10 [Candidatus Falkowbacteria bacterium CG10_big_fil_rev_8_21_14_0_10_37_6]